VLVCCLFQIAFQTKDGALHSFECIYASFTLSFQTRKSNLPLGIGLHLSIQGGIDLVSAANFSSDNQIFTQHGIT